FLGTLEDNGEVRGFRVELKKSGGSLFPAALFSREISFDGQYCILTVVHDLTEIMFLEKQLRQSQKIEAIGTLTSGIAHDFNNILSAIFGYTELTADLLDLEKDKKIIGYLDNVLKAADRAKSMIVQMMDFCRQTEKEKKPFHISLTVTEVVEMMCSLTPSDIVIRFEIKNKDMVVMGDPTQIHQVVTNLITNSIHALTGKGGKIEVILDKADIIEKQWAEILIPKLKSGVYARITVKDNGPGIGKGVIHNIFDPFFTTKPVGKGSGMGLAVIHGIVQGHNGAISVESEPGKGAAFHCYFPVTEHDNENAKPDVEFTSIKKGDARILLVDDESLILDLCTNVLRTMGYHITPCAESWKALKIFKNSPEDFDLVLTDNLMAEISGIELSKEILKIRPDIPIILITGTLFETESELKKTGIRAVSPCLVVIFIVALRPLTFFLSFLFSFIRFSNSSFLSIENI
ncbi:ATP-binding protein, partial [Desulfobacterales bacterium HSG17]|nr:ATP-binding protein [Desulfobacterales bacterium HSG17]